jgi:prophage antirepressor-like protein
MAFFLDVFNHVLKMDDRDVFIIFDKNGNCWFAFKQLLIAIGYKDPDKTRKIVDISCANIKKYEEIKVGDNNPVPHNFQKNTDFINEQGFNEVLTHSRKPLAKLFMSKYINEIMPQIRRTGEYKVNEKEMQKIKKLNEKLEEKNKNYQNELAYYYDKYKFIPSSNGYFYINEERVVKNGKKIKCYKIGYCDNMQERIINYKTGNFNHKLIAYIPLKTDKKQTENCIKNLFKGHQLKTRTDTLCFTSLEKLKEEISTCLKSISDHICECTLCKKHIILKI